MIIKLLLEFAVVLAAIALGCRSGGVGLGLWGAVGVLVLSVVFALPPTSPPIEVILIILAVITAASVMEAAGGLDYLTDVAERVIRRYPKRITVVAPLVAYTFTLGAGTTHILYPLLPVIYEVAYNNGVRPERPMAVSTIASMQGITASPVSAAMAAMITLFAPLGFGLPQIMLIALPATLTGVITASLVQMRVGKALEDDPGYHHRLQTGEIEPPKVRMGIKAQPALLPRARLSAILFLIGVLIVVLAAAFPGLRPQVPSGAKLEPLSMPLAIQIVMLSMAAVILLLTKAPVAKVPKAKIAQAGFTAIIAIFGLAWLGDTFIHANRVIIIGALSDMVRTYAITFAVGLFFASVLLFSQAVTSETLMPLGISLGIPLPGLIGMWPAVNSYFFLPTYGSLIAAINFDHTGTTRIGKYILNHSFMIPGIIATTTAVLTGLIIGTIFF
jgi:anaerobic C4-dicarboxylate transporter DcuA